MSTHHTRHGSNQISREPDADTKKVRLDVNGSETEARPNVIPIPEDINDNLETNDGRSLLDHVTNIRFIAYLIVFISILFIQLYLISNRIAEIRKYSQDTGFIHPIWMMVGTLISYLVAAFISYRTTEMRPGYSAAILGMVIIYIFSTAFWYVNLSVRAELQVKAGQPHHGNGATFLLVALGSLLVIMWLSSRISISMSYLMVVPILWTLFLIYQWWFY